MEKQRTSQQNKALHKFFELVSEALNDSGKDMRVVLKPEVDIPWTPTTVKDYLWRPVQKVYLQKESTAELTTQDIDKIYEIFNRFIAKHGIYIPFPSVDSDQENIYNEQE